MKYTLLFLLLFSSLINGMINQTKPSYNTPSLKFLAAQKVAEQVNIDTNSLPDELEEYVEFIKKHQEHLNLKDYGPIAIWAGFYGHADILLDLIHVGFKEKKPMNEALMASLIFGKEQAVKVLLKHGASPNYLDERFQRLKTPIWVASVNGEVECLRLLLQHNIDNNIKNSHLPDVVQKVIDRGHPDVLTLLIEYGGNDINFEYLKLVRNHSDLPRISNYESSSNGHLSCMDILCKYGFTLSNLYSMYNIKRFSKLSSDKCLALECIQEKYGKKMSETILRKM